MKTVETPELGVVKLIKRRGAKNIRLTIAASGELRVTMPAWLPYAAGISYARSQQAWVERNRPKLPSKSLIASNQKVGKIHRLQFLQVPSSEAAATRVTATKIIVKHHAGTGPKSPETQQRAEKAMHRALKKEALQLLPPRIKKYAADFGFNYNKVDAKLLKRRWGSCDSHGNLTFNLFLMELPWELIDYVILHELTHTEHMNHGAGFWARLVEVCPPAKDLRRRINQYRPIIQADENA